MNEQNDRQRPGTALMLGAFAAAAISLKYMMKQKTEANLISQVALITGGTSGLGYLLAREFGREGCKIVICARDQRELQVAGDDLRGQGFDVLTVECDVADREQVEDMITQATDRFGRIDILVNNAGVIQFGPANYMDAEDYQSAMDTMFWGVVNSTLAVLPQMTNRRSGRIVNITSIGGKVSVPHLLPYNSAKFAATGFSEGLAAELQKDGITVTTILPGLMRTGSYFNAQFKGQQEKEFTLFSLGSSLPVITIDAERAARQIVTATKRGESERILSLPANILAKFHGLFPGATINILGTVNKYLLPSPAGVRTNTDRGEHIQSGLSSSAQRIATTLGRSAARRLQPDQNLPEEFFNDPRD